MRMRKKKHGAERLMALSSLVLPENEKITSGDGIFEDAARPMRLEIGCGKGDFICQLSARDDGYNYIAVEKIIDVIVVAAEKYAKERNLGGLAPNGGWKTPGGTVYKDGEKWDIPLSERGNVRFIPGDAKSLPELFGDSLFDSVYVNFCDPWPKKGYADRRLTSPGFLKEYIRILKPGGTFRFKTDNVGLFDYTLETVAECGYTITFSTRDLHHSSRAAENLMTEYERNFSEKGVAINCLEAIIPDKK